MLALVVLAFALSASERLSTTISVIQADPYERRLVDNSFVPSEFYASFPTVYQIDSRPVKVNEFWNAPLLAHKIQVKAQKRAGFWFVTRMNLLTGAK